MAGIQIYGAGRAGDGTNTNIQLLTQTLKDTGAWTFSWKDEVYSNIETRDSGFGLRASDKPIFGPDDEFDILEAFDAGALIDVANEGRIPPITRLKDGGILLYDSTVRLDYPNSGKEVKLEAVQGLIESKKLRVMGLPMGQMAKEQLNLYRARGTIAVGVIAHLTGMADDAILERTAKRFGADSDIYKMNAQALSIGRKYAEEQNWAAPELKVNFTPIPNDQRQIMLGNDAVALGAIVAGCRVYAGYPITPASEVLEFMADHINKFGGAMIQADSEMAAAHHVIGAALAGARSMTATSGPGFDLMQEAISASGITETPMVIVLCTRGGPGTGLPTRQGQEELNEAIFGSHGDIARIVLAVSEPEDAFYVMEHVFNLAERYQCPVFLLQDQMLAQSSYTVPELDPSGFVIDRGKLLSPEQFAERYGDNRNGRRYKRYEVTEDGISYRAIPGTPGVTNFYSNTNEHTEDGYLTEEEVHRQVQMDKRYMQRMELIRNEPQLPQPRLYGDSNAKIGFISYGGTYGPIREAVERMDAMGVKAKFMELRTLWPLDGAGVKAFIDSCDVVYVPEYTAGAQLRGLIQREATGPLPKLKSILRYDGRNMTPGWLISRTEEAKVGN
ncbi:MAG TPA: 2-oxoacid:acceptor oxidoreductase subunit alpha [Dehalococcoidia bacterium]|nr:2-oxoacid:acceptor oxidoreductase subunit alpha [Dehalococcoidia bacterium]